MNEKQVDLIIRNGTVIDGTKAPRYEADVAVQDGRIVAIGELAGYSAKQTLDAKGRIVAPGFIDSHTHDDMAVISHPDMDFKVSQGVTTVIGGNCGISAAPLRRDMELPMPLALVETTPEGRSLHQLRRVPGGAARQAILGERGGDGRPLDAARRGDARPRPPSRRAGDRADARDGGRGHAGRRHRPVDRHLLSAGGGRHHRGDHRGGAAAERAQGALRHAHARRRRPRDRVAGGNLPHRPRAGRAGGRVAPQGAEPSQLRPLQGDLVPDPGNHEAPVRVPGLLPVRRRLHHDPHRPRHAGRARADRLQRPPSRDGRPRPRRHRQGVGRRQGRGGPPSATRQRDLLHDGRGRRAAHHGVRRDHDRLRRRAGGREAAPAPVGHLPARAGPLQPRRRPVPAGNRRLEDDRPDRAQFRLGRPRHAEARPGRRHRGVRRRHGARRRQLHQPHAARRRHPCRGRQRRAHLARRRPPGRAQRPGPDPRAPTAALQFSAPPPTTASTGTPGPHPPTRPGAASPARRPRESPRPRYGGSVRPSRGRRG